MIEASIKQLLTEGYIEAQEVLVVNTIPLTPLRFAKSRSWFGRSNDFVTTQFPKNIKWKDYKTYLVDPVLAELAEIHAQSVAVIDHDVSWKKFKGALNSRQFKVYFLLAHHIEKEDAIEFADVSVSLSVMYAHFKQLDSPNRKSVNFVICSAAKFSALKEEKVASIGSISFAFWNLPVRACYRFVKYWAVNIKKTGNLSQAYSKSINQFLHDNFPNL